MITIGKIKALVFDLMREKISWLNVWEQKLYQKGDQVTDDGWLMTANKATDDNAAPQEIGGPEFILDDVPAWVVQSDLSVILSGQKYTFTEGGWVTAIRVWAPEVGPDISYKLIIITQTAGGSETVSQTDISPNSNAWTLIGVGSTPVEPGSIITVLLQAINSGSSTIITGGWTYGGIDNNNAPANESWNRNTQQSIVRIDDQDLDTVDRSTELSGIVPGSTLQFTETAIPSNFYEYVTVGAVIDQGTYFQYPTALQNSGASGPTVGQPSTLTATVPIAQNTQYVEIAGHWPGNQPVYANVEGILFFDNTDQNLPNNAYGTDIQFQRAELSPDWDITALSALSTNSATSSAGKGGLITARSQIKTRVLESLGLSTTTNDFDISPVIKYEITENIEGDDYFILFGFEPGIDVTNRRVVVALYIDGALIDSEFEMEPKDINSQPYPTKILPHTFSDGDHVFRVDFGVRGGGGAAIASLENVRIMIARR